MVIHLFKSSPHSDMPAMKVFNFTKEFYSFIKNIVCGNYVDDFWDIKGKKSTVNPIPFQGELIYDEKDGWILIEFWTNNFDSVCAFFDEMIQEWNSKHEDYIDFGDVVYHC